MNQVTIAVLDKLQARMKPGRIYDETELKAAGLVPDPQNGPNDPWHLRVPVRRFYASRRDVADYATRNYPGTPITDVPIAELEALKKEHRDYGTYVRLHSSEVAACADTWVPTGRITGTALNSWRRKGYLDGLPELEAAITKALAIAKERRGAAVFGQYMRGGRVTRP